MLITNTSLLFFPVIVLTIAFLPVLTTHFSFNLAPYAHNLPPPPYLSLTQNFISSIPISILRSICVLDCSPSCASIASYCQKPHNSACHGHITKLIDVDVFVLLKRSEDYMSYGKLGKIGAVCAGVSTALILPNYRD